MATVLEPIIVTGTKDPVPDLTVKRFDQRDWRISVAGAELPKEIDCSFDIEKSKRPEDPNSCKLRIYNLSRASRDFISGISQNVKLNKKGTGKGSFKQVGAQTGDIRVDIEAGYIGAGRTRIFRGDLRTASSERSGTDILTTIWGEDGGYSTLVSRVSASFPPGTPMESVARYCAARMGVGEGNLPAVFNGGLPGVNIPGSMVFDEGTALFGSAFDELRRILRGLGVSFSIQDGVIQCRTAKGFIPSTRVVLSPTSGLVGSPVKESTGFVKATCLIQPGLFVDGRVRFETEDFRGDYVIQNLRYDGETFGKSWYAHIEVK